MKKTYRWSPFCDLTDFPREDLAGAFNLLSGRRRLLPVAFARLEKLKTRAESFDGMLALLGAGQARRLRALIAEGFLVDGDCPRAGLLMLRQSRHEVAKDFAPPDRPLPGESLLRLAVPSPASALGRRLQTLEPGRRPQWARDGLELLEKLSGTRGFLDDGELLCLYFLARTIPPRGDVVELGSFLGRSTAALALGASRARKTLVHAVDLWPDREAARPDYALFGRLGLLRRGNVYPAFKANMRRLGLARLVRAHREDSRAFARSWKTPIALLFIDGRHRYETVRRELKLARRLAPGGLLVFDDCDAAHPGVMWAAREHLDRGGYGERGRFGKILWARNAPQP